jgi:hypothetical protein
MGRGRRIGRAVNPVQKIRAFDVASIVDIELAAKKSGRGKNS